MARKATDTGLSQLYLVQALEGEVGSWREQGWPGTTETTRQLLSYWFSPERDAEAGDRFYRCQQEAIETVVYCHEILRVPTLQGLYERIAQEALLRYQALKTEVESIRFPKYCVKMATGSGKTWVLWALLVWQYFNALNKETPGRYSSRFLIVTPGHEVLNRLLDSFQGKRDPETGNRDPQTADKARELFMPSTTAWRDRFHIDILEPSDVRANTTPPDGPFVFLTNWQQFRLSPDEGSYWDQLTGGDVEEQPRGEVIADFLSEFPDLVIMNDEAHHVHGNRPRTTRRTGRHDYLVWRHFMDVLYERMEERHAKKRGLFLQLDFSATPFYGSAERREYFPHIVYDYDLLHAMDDMLVKQLFLEEREAIGGEKLTDLDFRAERAEPEGGHRRGQVTRLSAGQKLLLDIGRRKLEQLSEEFRDKKLTPKPVMMVLAEETGVAEKVKEHFGILTDERGNLYDDSQVMVIHSDLPDKQLEEARSRLYRIDEDEDPLRVVISVLMLREGFDKNNICVTVVLRATEADLLLEQIVGRGLRLMYPPVRYPALQEAKKEAFAQVRRGRTPSNSLDFLFIVEHPRFRAFYDELRRQGYSIGVGDTSQVEAAGDIIPVEAIPERIPTYDIAWPVLIYEEGKLPDLQQIDVKELPAYPQGFDTLQRYLSKLRIQDVHVPTGRKSSTWKLDNKYFDYNFFLRRAAQAVAQEGKTKILTAKLAEIAALVDEYASHQLFGKDIDFSQPENYQALNFTLVFDHVIQHVRQAIIAATETAQYEVRRGVWRRLSDVDKIYVRESRSVETDRSIYPRLAYAVKAGGFERDFMEETLNTSSEVLSYAKLDRKHKLFIPYRDPDAIYREYEIDFIVKTPEMVYLVETKADKDIDLPVVAIKARAAQAWCENASGIEPPDDLPQPTDWEYLLISEKLFYSNRGLGFGALVPQCQALRDKVIAQQQGKLFD